MRNPVHLTIERRLATLLAGSVVGSRVCVTDPTGCCPTGSGGGSGSGGGNGGAVATDCCAQALPTTLVATLVDAGNMSCVSGSIILVSSGTAFWSGTGALGSCGRNLTLALTCNSGDWSSGAWRVNYSYSDICNMPGSSFSTSSSCSPFQVVFTISTSGGCGATGSPSLYQVIITE